MKNASLWLAGVASLALSLAACQSDDDELDGGSGGETGDVAVPDSGTIDPDSGTIDPDSGTIDPDSGTIDPDSGTIDPDSGTIDPDSGTIDPDSGTIGPDSGVIVPDAPITVHGTGAVEIENNGDYAPLTSDGIPPYSYATEALSILNTSDDDVVIRSITIVAEEPSWQEEWYICEAFAGTLTPLEVTDQVIPSGTTFDFGVYFTPIESGPRSATVLIDYGAGTYSFHISGRGRDNATLSPVVTTSHDWMYGKRTADALVGGAVAAGDRFCFTQNVNQWTDRFAENITLTCLNANGSLAWSKEWVESYEQLQPDPGQNAESGGAAESLAYGAEGALYFVGQRSQSNLNSVFQALVTRVDPATGDVVWARGVTRGPNAQPAVAAQSIKGYAIDATLADRVLVTGQAADSAGAFIAALSKADGSLIWGRELNLSPTLVSRGHTIVVAADGTAFVGGLTAGRGFLAKLTGVNGDAPELSWAHLLDLGVGSNPNSLTLDGAGGVYAALDVRGAITAFVVARFDADGNTSWSKVWDAANSTDNDNVYVVRKLGAQVLVGGRIALQPFDTQYGDGFVMSLTDAGAWNWGAFYYSGKGTEEIIEHRVKGLVPHVDGGLWALQQAYPGPNNENHYWGRWYQANDDTLELPAGNGSGRLADYPFNNSAQDISTNPLLVLENGTAHVIDTTAIWQNAPEDATLQDPREREPNNGNSFAFIEQLSVMP